MSFDVHLEDFQAEIGEWSRKNFGTQDTKKLDPFLGVVEEVGELSHAILKKKQGIRGTAAEHDAAIKDAIGDILIYLADFCERNELSMQEIAEDTWAVVSKRDWTKNKLDGS